jgi:hypothetical protein
VSVSVYRSLAKAPDERDAELERLRARVAELEAAKPTRLVPEPIAKHYDTTDPDAGEESCACGEVVETRELLQQHIAEGNAKAEPRSGFWPGFDVVRKGGMPPGFPSSLRVSRVIPIDGSGITTPQRWQFQAVGRNEWFHCDEYVRAV